MVLCEDFVKFDVQTNQKNSRDTSKVSNFLHSDIFTAFGSFLFVLIITLSVARVLKSTSVKGAVSQLQSRSSCE